MSRSQIRFLVVSLWGSLVLLGLLIFAPQPTNAADPNTPKLEVGKVYEAGYTCLNFGGGAKSCYTELWLVQGIGKDGWVRVLALEWDQVWWVNMHRVVAIREAVKTPASGVTPNVIPEVGNPNPRIEL